MSSTRLKTLANRLQDSLDEMRAAKDEFHSLLRQAEQAGEEIGLDVLSSYNAYQHAQLTILLDNDHSYMTNEAGLHDAIEQVEEAAEELERMEDEEE